MLPRRAGLTQTLVAFPAAVALLRPRGELEFPRTATSGSGERASSSNGAGSGGSGTVAATAKERAAGYLREKERKQAVAADDSDRPRSRLAEAAAEFTESQQAFMLSSPSGLGVGAEAAIAQAIKDGALDNLAGTGKPLKQEDHSAQFFRVDPLVQAATRTMGAQSVRPLSAELQDELQRELAALRAQLASELGAATAAAAVAAGKAPQAEQSSSSGGGGGGSGGGSSSGGSMSEEAVSRSTSSPGWFSRFLGTGGGEARGTHAQRHTVASIRAERHEGLQHAAGCVQELIKEYNSAVLSDKEMYGGAWPLEQTKQLDWGAEVDAVLQRVSSRSTAGTAGGSTGSTRT